MIAESMQQRLESGEWSVDRQIPSCREFAQFYGVSLRTAWLALKKLEREGRVRMIARSKSIMSRPIPISNVLKGTIAIVSKMHLADFAGVSKTENVIDSNGIGHGIIRELSKTRSPMLFLQEARWWRRDSPQGLADQPVAGIIITTLLRPALLNHYASLGIPSVAVDQPVGSASIHSISTANREAAMDATSRLIRSGHRRLAFLRYIVRSFENIDPDSKERHEGFIDACKQAALSETDYTVFSTMLEDSSATIHSLIHKRPPYTAILVSNQFFADQIFRAANAAGLRIPMDLSIVVFHDRQNNVQQLSGPGIDFEEMGRAAVRLLQNKPETVRHLRLTTQWNEGTTSAPPNRRREARKP
jgi:hypothetical protein